MQYFWLLLFYAVSTHQHEHLEHHSTTIIHVRPCPLTVKPPCVCVPAMSLEGAPSITCSNATGNEITDFMDEIPTEIEIEDLSILDTPISRLTPFSFGARIAVRRIRLNRNGLSLIHTLFFVNNVELELMEELDLSENSLIEPPSMIQRMENIKTIRLRRNRISRYDILNFENTGVIRKSKM